MAVEHEEIEIKTNTIPNEEAIPPAFYQGRDPETFSDVAEQNRNSIQSDFANAQEKIIQLINTEVNTEAQKNILLARARELCLDPAINNSTAFIEYKILELERNPNSPLKNEYDPLDPSQNAQVYQAIESYFKRRRDFFIKTQEAKKQKREALLSKLAQTYKQGEYNLKYIYYNRVWPIVEPHLPPINALYPTIEGIKPPVSKLRKTR